MPRSTKKTVPVKKQNLVAKTPAVHSYAHLVSGTVILGFAVVVILAVVSLLLIPTGGNQFKAMFSQTPDTGAGGGGGSSIPATPTGLSCTAGDAKAILNWAATPGATQYRFNRYKNGSYEIEFLANTTLTGIDSPLDNGTKYTYFIKAVNSVGDSANWSAGVDCTPTAVVENPTCDISFDPASINAGQDSTATWTSTNDADGKLEYSCTGNIPSGGTATVDPKGSILVTRPDTQTCTLTSKNSAKTVTCSATITVAAALMAPAKAATPTCTTSDQFVRVSWTAIPGLTYTVKRWPDGHEFPGQPTSNNFYDDTKFAQFPPANGTAYTYVVKAWDGTVGSEVWSDGVTCTPIAKPTGLTATPSPAACRIGWTLVPGAKSYSVKRWLGSAWKEFPVSSPSQNWYDDTPLAQYPPIPETKYTYQVKALNDSPGDSDWSTGVDCTPQTIVTAPTISSISPTYAIKPNLGTQEYTATATGATSYKWYHTQKGINEICPTTWNTADTPDGTAATKTYSVNFAGADGKDGSQKLCIGVYAVNSAGTAGPKVASLFLDNKPVIDSFYYTPSGTGLKMTGSVSSWPVYRYDFYVAKDDQTTCTNTEAWFTTGIDRQHNFDTVDGTYAHRYVYRSATHIASQVASELVTLPATGKKRCMALWTTNMTNPLEGYQWSDPKFIEYVGGTTTDTVVSTVTVTPSPVDVPVSTTKQFTAVCKNAAASSVDCGTLAWTTNAGTITPTGGLLTAQPTAATGKSVTATTTNSKSGSATVNITSTTGGAPSTPTGLTCSPGNAQAVLSWTASTGNPTSYVLNRDGTDLTASITTTSYTNTGLTNGTSYTYKVKAKNATGESPYSSTVSCTPTGTGGTPPTADIKANNDNGPITVSSGGLVTITWTSTNATSGAMSCTGTTATGTGTSGSKSINPAVTTTCTFTATGSNSQTASDTVTINISTTGNPPSAPTNLACTPGAGQVTLTWTASTGATSYVMYKDTADLSNSITTSTFVDTSVGTSPHSYKVKAVNASGSSAYSAVVSCGAVTTGGAVTEVLVTPNPANVPVSTTQQFSAQCKDASHTTVACGTLVWGTDAGTITQASGTVQGGLLTAQSTAAQNKYVAAVVGTIVGTSVVNITGTTNTTDLNVKVPLEGRDILTTTDAGNHSALVTITLTPVSGGTPIVKQVTTNETGTGLLSFTGTNALPAGAYNITFKTYAHLSLTLSNVTLPTSNLLTAAPFLRAGDIAGGTPPSGTVGNGYLHDNVVNGTDIADFLGIWGKTVPLNALQSNPIFIGDLDRNGKLGAEDFALMVHNL